jgi:CRISPR-associated protein Csm2
VDSHDDEERGSGMTQHDREDRRINLDEWGRDLARKIQDLGSVDAETLIDVAQTLGGFLGRKTRDNPEAIDLKMNQIRRFLDAVRKIESEMKAKSFDEVKDSVVLLRPKLAYAAGRERRVKPLMNVLDPAIKSGATSKENFNKLLRLIEGIIAYHRFYGGSN